MRKGYAILVLLMFLTTFISSCTSNKIEEDDVNNANKSNEKIGELKDKVYECDEKVLENENIEYSLIIDIEEKLEEEAFVNELKECIKNLAEDGNSLLYEKKGCFLSLENVCHFNIAENALMNGVNCYFFTEDKEPAGELMFYLNDGKIQYNISWYTKDNTSDILKKLFKIPDEKYVILTNGYNRTLIDKDNLSTNLDFEIKGDVYHALDYERIGVSYNSLIQNMVWIEFN